VKALITGMTGFAGSFLAEHLMASGDQVIGSSISGAWRDGTPAALRDQAALFSWDLGGDDPAAARGALREFQPDVVYHLAAVAVPSDCGAADPAPYAWAVNVQGTRCLLELLAELPRRPRLVLVSSCHVYAPVSPQQPRVDEAAPLGPWTGYGKTKLAAERETLQDVRRRGLDAILVRPFKHSGPRQNARLMLAEWCLQVVRAEEGPIQILNRDSWFDMTDVRDIARAYRLLALHGRSGEIYNVGSGRSQRSGDVFDRLLELAACGRPWIERNPGHRQEPIADIGRLQQTTGWQPQIPLDTTLQDTLAYWRPDRRGG
jgi:GDP-4-dehydro-6-deoxy-D-mannose reductase